METEVADRLFCLWVIVECGALMRLKKNDPHQLETMPQTALISIGTGVKTYNVAHVDHLKRRAGDRINSSRWSRVCTFFFVEALVNGLAGYSE
jgi:hypothetical protein